MAIEKIEKITYLYKASDGQTFTDEHEANLYENKINTLKTIPMLDANFRVETNVGHAFYILIENEEQLVALRDALFAEGYSCNIAKPGFYYYDENHDSYINIESEIEQLKHMKNCLIDRRNEMQGGV